MILRYDGACGDRGTPGGAQGPHVPCHVEYHWRTGRRYCLGSGRTALRHRANIGADSQHANRAAKGDRLTVISKGFVLPQVTVREMPRSTPAPVLATDNLGAAPAIPVGCDPVAAPYVEPALARVIGRCLS